MGQDNDDVALHRPSRRLEHVQALRAIAVGGVVIFHFWPRALPGGYLGVDVFFVISGFLITGGIVRDLERRRFSFREFYVRRVRRLIPAAALVALVSGVVATLVQPVSLWLDTFTELLAATLYVENWTLVVQGSDYFHGTPSLAQHYWSLSVEEQFYLVWPMVIAAAALLGRRTGSALRGIVLGLSLLTLASFVASVLLTRDNWQVAFFATHTRAWEFGVGALLALAPQPRRGRRHAAVGWLGAAVIAGCFVVYQGSWPFPGWIAALPVLATAACLWGGFGEGRSVPSRLALSPPFLWVGDVSYSLYLWHWPVVVLAPWVLGGAPSRATQLVLVALCLVLAGLTKKQVEDRFRVGGTTPVGSQPGTRRRGPLVATTALPVAVVALCVAHLGAIHAASSRADALEERALAEELACYGAGALTDPGCTPPFADRLVPDLPTAYSRFTRSSENRECMQRVSGSAVITCEFVDPTSDTTVALVGDSHGMAWLPAARRAAEERGWRVITYLRGACPVNAADTERYIPGEEELCSDWSQAVIDEVAADPDIDLVMTAALNTVTWTPSGGRTPLETGTDGYADAWGQWIDSGKPVLVMEETPLPRPGVLECLSREPAEACARPEAEASQPRPSPLHAAAKQMADSGEPVHLLPVWDLFCGDGQCPAVAGNVVVYVDDDHVSQAYMRTLATHLGEGWDTILNRQETG